MILPHAQIASELHGCFQVGARDPGTGLPERDRSKVQQGNVAADAVAQGREASDRFFEPRRILAVVRGSRQHVPEDHRVTVGTCKVDGFAPQPDLRVLVAALIGERGKERKRERCGTTLIEASRDPESLLQ
ncbi:MAG: hypothetical protein ACLP6E_19035, partial [Acidimicrobiales bacterium]